MKAINTIIGNLCYVSLILLLVQHTFSQSVLQGQVAHFPFNTNLTDVSPSNIAATNTGGVFIDDRFGLANNAIDLSGNNYVHFNDASVKVDLPLTISAWVYVYSFSELNIVFKSDNIYDNYHGYWLNVIASNGRVGINFSGGTGGANASNRRTFLTNTSLPLQQWVLVTAIIRTGQDMDIYFNCDLQPGTYSGTGSMSIAYSTTNSRIGSSVGDNALQSDRFFNGVIDDLIIWDRELTVAEITYYCSQSEQPCPDLTLTTSDQSNVSCFGGSNGSATVIAEGGIGPYTYTWIPGSLSGSSQSNLSSGNYTVNVIDANNCAGSTIVNISEPAAIVAGTGEINAANCGSNDGSASITASGGTGTLMYTWTPNISSTASATNIGAGLYSVVVSDAIGCAQTVNFLVPSVGGLTVAMSDVEGASCFGVADGTATAVVTGGNAPFTILWTPTGGTNATATGLSAGSYSVLVTDDFGCIGTADVTIISPAAISITEIITDAGCGTSNGQIALTAAGGTGTLSYLWSPGGQNTATISSLSTGNYNVTVTDVNGCIATENYIVGVSAEIDITVFPELATINEGETVQLESDGATFYNWSPSSGLSCNNCPNPIASPMTTTTYLVEGINDFGCVGSTSVTIYVIQLIPEIVIPNVFTPNADESNDFFSVSGFEHHKDFQIVILNRWGNAMFTSTDPNFTWNGQDQSGLEATEGVYFYLITGLSPYDGKPKEFHGFIHLVR
jgi:gliding motility-associated-like protein